MEDSLRDKASHGNTAVASAAETVHAHDLSDAPSEITSKPGTKICCVCGKNVAHEERFKDKLGRYWCYDCGVADSHRRHGDEMIKCPDCDQPFAPSDLVPYDGHHLCAGCVKKRTVAAKREAARIAAAEAAERQAQLKWRLMVSSSVIFALLAIALVIWRVV